MLKYGILSKGFSGRDTGLERESTILHPDLDHGLLGLVMDGGGCENPAGFGVQFAVLDKELVLVICGFVEFLVESPFGGVVVERDFGSYPSIRVEPNDISVSLYPWCL